MYRHYESIDSYLKKPLDFWRENYDFLVGLKGAWPSKWVADEYYEDITDVEPDGYDGVIVDFDNTLARDGEEEIPERVEEWIKDVIEEVPTVILSNKIGINPDEEERAGTISKKLGIPVVEHKYRKPRRECFDHALKHLGLDGDQESEVAVIGDMPSTDILGGNKHPDVDRTIQVEPPVDDFEYTGRQEFVLRWGERFRRYEEAKEAIYQKVRSLMT